MAATGVPGRRRRARRGSLERPVDTRLYRAAFLVLLLPLLVLAFGFVRPAPLPAPILPPSFDGAATRALAADLSDRFPDRAPGGTGSIRAAQWFRDQMRQYDLPVSTDSWRADVPGLGRVRLQNLWAVAPGQSKRAIVVMAHRDDTGAGPGANDNASGTATLVELARSYALSSAPAAGVRSAHTIVFLSTDAGAFGGLGALRFAERPPFRVVAVVDLDAIAGAGPMRIDIAGDAPRSPAAGLLATARRRLLEQGERPVRSSVLAQLVDLGFPYTLYEQGPFVARGIPAIAFTTAGARPPDAFTDRSASLSTPRLGAIGRATQQLVGSLDQGLELVQGTTTYVWLGDRVVRGWAIELMLFALLIPFVVAVVDLFAHCRRRRIPLLPAARSLRSRVAVWLFAGAAFYGLRLLGAWPSGVPRPPNPSTPVAGDWHVLASIALVVLALAAWAVARPRLVPRAAVTSEERLAGETAALLGLAVVSLLVLATNPYALVFFLPALHVWLWLPHVRSRRGPAGAILLAAGLAGPALIVGSLAVRFGLGFDAPWYLAVLAAVGYVRVPAVVITLAAAACAAQLAAVTFGRYGPYPAASERPPRGPVRELVRRAVVASRNRRTSRRVR